MDKFSPKEYTYTPDESVNVAIEQAHHMKANHHRAMPLGLGGAIGDYFAPVLPGQVVAIIGQSSNNKSGMMDYLITQQAQHLTDNGREDEIIIWVSVEDTIEEAVYTQMAKYSGYDAADIAAGKIQDWSKLEQAALKIGDIPIYRIGESLARPNMESELYLSNMVRCIRYIAEELHGRKMTIAALHFDYLQAFPYDPEVRNANISNQRRLQVRQDIFRLRRAAQYFNCPVFVAVQAKQHLNNARDNWQMPGMYDGEESSAIGQKADRILTIWMPKQTHGINYELRLGDDHYWALENLMWVKVAKQRGRLPAGECWPCFIDFQTNEIEVSTVNVLLDKTAEERIKQSNYETGYLHD